VTHGVATHHHTDHALGASWFAARGAKVIAHERCAAAMLAQHPTIIKERRVTPALSALFAGAESYAPAATFSDTFRIDLGDAGAEARHLGPGHTQGDCIVLIPSERAVACGDLVFSGYHFNYEEADLKGLPAAPDALRSIDSSRVLRPGARAFGRHGTRPRASALSPDRCAAHSRCKLAHRGARRHSRAVPGSRSP